MSTSDICKICKDGASKSNNDVCDVNDDMLQNLSTANEDNDSSVCANCGKDGDEINNICNKCKKVKYCNAACKKKHRHKHKKECEEYIRLAAEHAAELHDEELFKQPPQVYEDCPICFLIMPELLTGRRYQACCGKFICSGCLHAPLFDNQGNEVDNKKCPFCRTPFPKSNEDSIERLQKRVKFGDPVAMNNLGNYYQDSTYGLSQDYDKALELLHRAAELGYAIGYLNIGYSYDNGEGVEIDQEKATYYYEVAAMAGVVTARYNLGTNEARAGNMNRALKHHLIAARGGDIDSLDEIKELYSNGHVTKEDYTKALQAYQEYLSEVKSVQRDKAAAADDQYRYY